MNELKLSIARELARQAFGNSSNDHKDSDAAPDAISDDEVLRQRLFMDRMARSARTIAEPTTKLLYSPAIERQMVTNAKMELILPSLVSLGQDDRCSMQNLAVQTIKSFQVLS